MITKAQAIDPKNTEFHATFAFNSDGTCMRWRVNGNTQTWTTRPNEFRIPVKHGMRDCSNITDITADWYHLASECTNSKEGN